ncbi:MAG: glycoside hydrolase family 2 TIM barrel-domain containing protein [Woeseia sp.]
MGKSRGVGTSSVSQPALLLVLLLGASIARAEFPDAFLIQNPQGRESIQLDGPWRVIPDPYENGYFNHRYEPRADGYFQARKLTDPTELVEYDFRRSQALNVPGDWNSQDERYFFYEGTMWYFKSFELMPQNDRRYLLHFGAVNYIADVWVNGEFLGRHEGGFTPFQFEAGHALTSGENVVVVKVDNRRAPDQVPAVNTDWWNYGGITRSVRLIDVPGNYIADYRVGLSGEGAIEGWVRIAGAADRGPVTVSIPALSIVDALSADAEGFARFSFDVKPERWSPASPSLYEIRIAYAGDAVADKIGFRTIAVRGEDILLNDVPIFLRGISLHEEAISRPGRAWSYEDARALLQRALDLDCNFVRLAHYPHNENMLRAADEMGLLVWAEIPVYWTIDFESHAVLEKARQQLDEMIARDANRASIVLWSMANETPAGAARLRFIEELASHARRLDSTRLITAALDTQTADRFRRTIDDPLAGTIDVIGINSYCGWYSDAPADCARIRWVSPYGKPVIMSEMGAGALQGMHGNAAHRWTEEYQAEVYVQNLEMLDNITPLRGLSPWILKDFRSPRRPLPGIQDFWNRKGLLSETGTPKKAWYILRDYYRSAAGDRASTFREVVQRDQAECNEQQDRDDCD